MPWPLEWSLVAICGLLVLYGFWMSSMISRLRRSVLALEDTVSAIHLGQSAPDKANLNDDSFPA